MRALHLKRRRLQHREKRQLVGKHARAHRTQCLSHLNRKVLARFTHSRLALCFLIPLKGAPLLLLKPRRSKVREFRSSRAQSACGAHLLFGACMAGSYDLSCGGDGGPRSKCNETAAAQAPWPPILCAAKTKTLSLRPAALCSRSRRRCLSSRQLHTDMLRCDGRSLQHRSIMGGVARTAFHTKGGEV